MDNIKDYDHISYESQGAMPCTKVPKGQVTHPLNVFTALNG